MNPLSPLILRADYGHIPEARRALHEFATTIFGLDLSRWEHAGFWDPAYVPFSLLSRSRIVSNVSVYSLSVVIAGRPYRAAQLATVGTLPGHRRRGYNSRLLHRAVEWAKRDHAFVFLFANAAAVPYYRQRGFRPLAEYTSTVDTDRVRRARGLRRLDPENEADQRLLFDYAQRRGVVSERLGVLGPRLFMFHCLYGLRRHIYHVPALETIILFRRSGGRLIVYDVVAAEVPPFRDLFPFITTGEPERVAFRFVPDKMKLSGVRSRLLHGHNAHCVGDWPLDSERIIFPHTARA